ncbi:YitT family protein [Paenibacillus sp. MMS20-IR301]|uniref:YczE/YyaS/YitT family protein n=1 Tax=Paenibacillus sp. MMS20-IR301 TaxID=2895946 RepID=UPI0028E464BD|nr:YitT family protein [Paenibacillus sp. MMS20-IR301]WNS46037.1 YitT family protein [Paenibacillus sp. MMS20-IR301]
MDGALLPKSRIATFAVFSGGIIILTFGVALTILADLGTSPFDALLVGLSEHVGLTVGSWEVLIACLLIGCNACLSRQRPEMLGLITAFITGLGIDMWIFLLHKLIEPDLWISQAAAFALGMVTIGLGTAVYLRANFAPIPIDRLTLVLLKITKLNILYTRTIIYLVFLLAALLFHGPIGAGTVLTVCLGGVILKYWMSVTEKGLGRLLPQA